MVIYRKWKTVKCRGLLVTYWEGWFLLGIIPLYIKQLNIAS